MRMLGRLLLLLLLIAAHRLENSAGQQVKAAHPANLKGKPHVHVGIVAPELDQVLLQSPCSRALRRVSGVLIGANAQALACATGHLQLSNCPPGCCSCNQGQRVDPPHADKGSAVNRQAWTHLPCAPHSPTHPSRWHLACGSWEGGQRHAQGTTGTWMMCQVHGTTCTPCSVCAICMLASGALLSHITAGQAILIELVSSGSSTLPCSP
jgi:hypothetical protein